MRENQIKRDNGHTYTHKNEEILFTIPTDLIFFFSYASFFGGNIIPTTNKY